MEIKTGTMDNKPTYKELEEKVRELERAASENKLIRQEHQMLATTTDTNRQTRTRNRCNSVGYESVALIPLRSANETFGLIQLNDHREGRFTPELMGMYRRVRGLAVAFFTMLLIWLLKEFQKVHHQPHE